MKTCFVELFSRAPCLVVCHRNCASSSVSNVPMIEAGAQYMDHQHAFLFDQLQLIPLPSFYP